MWIPLRKYFPLIQEFFDIYSLLHLSKWKQRCRGRCEQKAEGKKPNTNCYLQSELILVSVKFVLFLLTLLGKGLVHRV